MQKVYLRHKRGKKMCCCGKTRLNKAFHLLALVVLLFGLWYRSFGVIIAAIVVALIGHLTELLTRKATASIETVVARKKRR